MNTQRVEAMSVDIIPVLKQVVLAGYKLNGISLTNKEIRAAGVAKLKVKLNAECPDELRVQLLQRANVVNLELWDDLRSTPIFIPDSVKKLDIWDFEGTIINMPAGLESAKLTYYEGKKRRICGTAYELDQLISQLPSGLSELDIRNMSTTCANKCCCTDYPSGLQRLSLSYCDTIDAPLPAGLKELMIDDAPETAVYPVLPDGLEDLRIFNNYSINTTASVYPDSLQKLFLQVDTIPHQSLPPNLVSCSIISANSFTIGTLPSGLQELDLHTAKRFNSSLGTLPPSLRILGVGERYNQPLLLPPNLQILHLGYYFSATLGQLPEGLQLLRFEGEYGNLEIPPLPTTLLEMEVPSSIIKSIQIPQGLRLIIVNGGYDFTEEDYDRPLMLSRECETPGLTVRLN